MGHIKTIVADGNEIFRIGISAILQEADFEISSEIDNGALILAAFENIKPDLCVLSFTMPEINGIELANKIVDRFPDAKILILAKEASHQVLSEFLDSGANGLVLKTTDRIELVDAAQKISAGDTYLGKQFSKMMTREYVRLTKLKPYKNSQISLSKREREILTLLVDGLTSVEIATKLFISHRTVDKHRSNILKKLGLRNIASLVRYAIEQKS